MEASPVNIIQYFDGSKQGVIPLFQRPYSWEKKNWEVLWDDLMAQYEEEEGNKTPHFLGAIVTISVKSVPVGVTKHLVIDGQQRLITLSILLAAIRDYAKTTDDPSTENIIGDFLVNRHYKAPDDLKLVPTQIDRTAYNALIYHQDLEQHKASKVIQAYDFFAKKLNGHDLDENPINALQTLHTIQQSLQVVMINLNDTDDPYLIFESLNHKGMPLSQADLVRNYVLMRFKHSTSSGGEQEKAYEELWKPIETTLGLGAPLIEFLRHYGMSHGLKMRKDNIYTAYKADFENVKDIEGVRRRLEDITRAANAYGTFLTPANEKDESIAKRLKRIQVLDSTVFYPLLIRIHQAWQQFKTLTLDDFLQCLDMLESFYVRRLICDVPTNSLNNLTLELCQKFPRDNATSWLHERLLQGNRSSRWPDDVEFSNALVTGSVYRRPIARYLLTELEYFYGHKEPVDAANATIEHIMPQTLSEEWESSLGPEHDAIHDEWLHTIGNLTLTGYNSELQNHLFDEKKKLLQNTHFELSRFVLNSSAWGATEIEARGKKLAEQAVHRWSRD